MSIFEKLGLTEREINIDNINIEDIDISQKVEIEDLVETSDFSDELIVPEQMYETANYINDSNIFKVKEFKDALPSNMSNDLMKQSVLGILKASNLSVEDLIQDGNKRIEIISANQQKLINDTNDYISNMESKIETLSKEIEDSKNLINNKKMYLEKQNQLLDEEQNNIKSIINFIKEN